MSHEIITLQFGNYSNYIGTHYWNIQVKLVFFFNLFNYINLDKFKIKINLISKASLFTAQKLIQKQYRM